MTPEAKDNLLHYRDLICGVVFTIALLGGMVGLSLYWFLDDPPAFWWCLAVQSAIAVLLYKIYRWWRWPGTYHAKTSGRLIRDCALSVLFVWSLPLIALIARFHLLNILPLRKIGRILDLTFPFSLREKVQVSRVAPAQFQPGAWGIVRGIRVIGPNENIWVPLPVGSLVYRVGFGAQEIDIPEAEIIPPD
jgi:hypothetical protein